MDQFLKSVEYVWPVFRPAVIKFLKGFVKSEISKRIASKFMASLIGGPLAFLLPWIVDYCFEISVIHIAYLKDKARGRKLVRRLDLAIQERNDEEYDRVVVDILNS